VQSLYVDGPLLEFLKFGSGGQHGIPKFWKPEVALSTYKLCTKALPLGPEESGGN